MTRGDVASEISKKEVLVVVSNSQDRNTFFHFRFEGAKRREEAAGGVKCLYV